MVSLIDLIRMRVIGQSFHDPPTGFQPKIRSEILDRAHWLYSDYDFNARSAKPQYSIINRLFRDGAIKVQIFNITRYVSLENLQLLAVNFRNEIIDSDLFNYLDIDGFLNKNKMMNRLNITEKDLNKRISKEIKNWNLVRVKNGLQTIDSLIKTDRSIDDTESNQKLILKILTSYPILTLNQISFLTGIRLFDLDIPISNLLRYGLVMRNISRDDSPEEYFSLTTTDINSSKHVNWDQTNSFVLDKRDPLVELIKLEKYFKYGRGNYWLFISGIPQAEFSLKKENKSNQYIVHNFRRLIGDRSLENLILDLQDWSENAGINLNINLETNEYAQPSILLVNFLLSRGYSIDENSLVLNYGKESKLVANLNWHSFGSWYRETQLFMEGLDIEDITKKLVQIDTEYTYMCRTNRLIQLIESPNIIYTAGINYRMGYVHLDFLELIIQGWPKTPKINHFDRQIINIIAETHCKIQDIAKQLNRSTQEILARIRYLEMNRLIVKDLNTGLDMSECEWMIFPRIESPISRSKTAIAKILQLILSINIPLTISQITKYLGITSSELDIIISNLINSDMVVEGYFMEDVTEKQLSVYPVLDQLQLLNKIEQPLPHDVEEIDPEEEYTIGIQSYSNTIDILHQNDILCQLHLGDLITINSELAITKRLPRESTIWMIMWNGIPIGFVIQYPSLVNLIDFDFELKILKDMITKPILSMVLEKIGSFLGTLQNDRLRWISVNDEKANSQKYQHFHFLIQSVGIEIIK